MPTPEVVAHRQSIVACAEALVRAGILSASQHGNISALLPDRRRLLLTARSSLANLRGDELALLDLNGEVLEGRLEPTSREIIRMHTVVYEHRPDVGAVIHTHSPHATAFAVAGRPIECVAEVMARFLGPAPIPLARFGARGSPAAVANIATALREHPGTRAVLLEHHGVLVFGDDVEQATRVAMAVEEGAQLALLASALGPLRALPEEAAVDTAQRRREFEQAGAVSAGGDGPPRPTSR